MIKVYHAVIVNDHDANLHFMLGLRPKIEAVQEAVLAGKIKYVHVADVRTDDKWKAFEYTNHIDRDWTFNPEVTHIGKRQHRSTSAGDVIVDSQGVAYLLQGIGSEPIPTWNLWLEASSK